ncbi:hypothetical protein ERJ75_000987100 [Trypanosoma vivax]|uniref:PCI domain-containing protein n=1 Tax=Trypanosoma vivax (strain Y486) TaxID=1055687 RepID=G0U731_TRYVY|nr:hypothetical protein ERJ75_000987100 [Trypanosoma vivax]CCC51688.1 conserved hypothetical protein [Trypanosoma vivax Y486]
MRAPFLLDVSPQWLQRSAEGIVSRNGVVVADCVVQAELGEAARLPDALVLDNIIEAVDQLRQGILWHIDQQCAAAEDIQSDNTEDTRERQLYAEVLVRVAVTGALASFYRAEAGSDNRKLLQLSKDRFALGLLHVFEAFQEVHSMKRGNYQQHRRGSSTIGTVGWDTLVLLHFVHRIPCAAREASAEVIDEATGRIVRSWRKLLQSLQGADPKDAPEHSRRRGALAVCNGLLSILFRRYNTHQCRVIINSVEQSERVAAAGGEGGRLVIKPALHMTAEVLTFMYYKGRVMLYDRRLQEAHASFQQAYHLLPPPGSGTDVQQRNKQRVRFFLTVAGVANGRVVPEDIMQRDDLIAYIFRPMLAAAQRGDPCAFTSSVDSYGVLLRKRGVYFLLQHAKLMCFLVLVSRTFTALGTFKGVDNTRIPLPVLTAVYVHIAKKGETLLEKSKVGECSSAERPSAKEQRNKRPRGEDGMDDSATITDDEMTWWVAKLISTGLVRGYISYEHKTVVVSRQNPFPTLAPARDPNCEQR